MPWIRAIGEGAVIVVSILLAFVIDAAWQDSQEHVATREMLVAVQGELASNLESSSVPGPAMSDLLKRRRRYSP